jgi:hypothetical protein
MPQVEITEQINLLEIVQEPNILEISNNTNELSVTLVGNDILLDTSINSIEITQDPVLLEINSSQVEVLAVAEQGPTGAQGIPGISEEDVTYAKRTDFTVNETIIYKGEAAVGSAESSALWRVRRLTIAGDNDVTEEWAGGIDTFTQVWDDRLSFTYI